MIRRKNWSKKGKRRRVTGQRRRGRVNVMGGIRESDRKRVCFFIKKGNADTFYEQLQQFYEWLKDEWSSLGNRREDIIKWHRKIKNKGNGHVAT